MVRQLALQYADKGININAIAPGALRGNRFIHVQQRIHGTDNQEDSFEEALQAEEVAAAVLYLSSGRKRLCHRRDNEPQRRAYTWRNG
jgi:NAD(P)-dependent dehydrogenase (short-subunit alcohol dehydrogenase family)